MFHPQFECIHETREIRSPFHEILTCKVMSSGQEFHTPLLSSIVNTLDNQNHPYLAPTLFGPLFHSFIHLLHSPFCISSSIVKYFTWSNHPYLGPTLFGPLLDSSIHLLEYPFSQLTLVQDFFFPPSKPNFLGTWFWLLYVWRFVPMKHKLEYLGILYCWKWNSQN